MSDSNYFYEMLTSFEELSPSISEQMGYGVYFISDCLGHIKIGKTNNIYRRMIELQTNQPTSLKLFHWIGSTKKEYSNLEHQLHNLFSFCRCRGEWFFDKPVMDYMVICTGYWWSKELVIGEMFEGKFSTKEERQRLYFNLSKEIEHVRINNNSEERQRTVNQANILLR